MSLETLLKNFGGTTQKSKAEPVKIEPAKKTEPIKIDNADTQFDSITDQTSCGKCGNNFFWKWKTLWFCGRCRIPPAVEFIHDVRNGEFLIRRPRISQAKITDRQEEIASHVEAYDSVVVVEGDNACPECPCRWVKESPRDDGTVQRLCYSCKAVIPPGRHGTIRSQDKPFYLLPFWKWFNENNQEVS